MTGLTVIEGPTFERAFDTRTTQVAFMKLLDTALQAGLAPTDMLVGFLTPDGLRVLLVQADETDEFVSETDDWLSRIIAEQSRTWLVDSAGETVCEQDVITGFVVACIPSFPIVFSVGYTAAGRVEQDTLLAGHSGLIAPKDGGRLSTFLDRQARILWGSAWLPLP